MDEIIRTENTFFVCECCLQAIECHEGAQRSKRYYVDEEDEIQSKCDWCGETGFDVLFEI